MRGEMAELACDRSRWGWFRWRLPLTILGVLSGCDAPPPAAPGDEAQARDAAVGGSAAGDADAPGDLAVARPKKAKVIGGESVARTIAWPEASTIDPALRDRLAAASRHAADDAALPVLVPIESTDRGHLTVGDGWYAFSTRDGDTTVSVQGSARARIHAGIGRADPMHVVRGQGAFVSNNEGIWVVSWLEHGAAYSLELECDDPRAPACEGPARAVEIATNLGLVGGRGVQ